MKNRIPSTARFDWIYTFFTTWFVVGIYLDGWAHNHVPDLESFFTPWHGVLYSGYFATAIALLIYLWLRRKSAGSWREAIPVGYGWAVAGAALFFISGLLDLGWHTIWGIEDGIDALFSPTHIMLAVGAGMMMSAPLRSLQRAKPTRAQLICAVISLTYTLSVLTFMTQFIGFVRSAYPRPEVEDVRNWMQQLGILYNLLYTTFSLGLLTIWLRRLPSFFGLHTIFFGLNALAMHWAITDQFHLIPAAIIAGLAIDLLVLKLRPSLQEINRYRLYCFAVPFLLYLTMILAVIHKTGTWWTIHMWTGSFFIPAIAGWLLSYALVESPEAK